MCVCENENCRTDGIEFIKFKRGGKLWLLNGIAYLKNKTTPDGLIFIYLYIYFSFLLGLLIFLHIK